MYPSVHIDDVLWNPFDALSMLSFAFVFQYVIARTSLIEYTISQQTLNDKVIKWKLKILLIFLPRLNSSKIFCFSMQFQCQSLVKGLWKMIIISKKKKKIFLVSSDVNMYTFWHLYQIAWK